MKMKQLVQAAVEKFGYRIVPIDNTPRSKHAEGLDPLLSMLRPEEPGFLQTAMDVTTLNEIVRSRSESPPDMVKIDAEGLDLKVLDGASDLFGKTEIFLVEASVFSGGENTLAEVIHRMSLAGYHVIDITDLNRSPKYGVVWLCELAFLRNGSTLLNDVTSYE
jgi:hypothetical protein